MIYKDMKWALKIHGDIFEDLRIRFRGIVVRAKSPGNESVNVMSNKSMESRH